MKKFIPVVLAVMISLIITVITSGANQSQNPEQVRIQTELDGAVFQQEILRVYSQPQMVTKIYDANRLIGVLSDSQIIDSVLSKTYQDLYAIDFPNSKIGLGEDIQQSS
jgi:hypothetical protein